MNKDILTHSTIYVRLRLYHSILIRLDITIYRGKYIFVYLIYPILIISSIVFLHIISCDKLCFSMLNALL